MERPSLSFYGFFSVLVLLATNGQKFGSSADLQCHCSETSSCDPDNGFCSRGCQAGWFGPGCQIGNIALNKSAYQSSTHTALDGVIYGASKAVDGILPMLLGNATGCSDTESRSKTWWYVEPGNALYVIQNVTLYNRLDQWRTRLRKFSILLSNASDGTPDPSTWSLCAFQEAYLEGVGTYNCLGSLARRIGVYIDFPEYMAICEAIVIGYEYVTCTDPSTTGPGCLLTTCTSKACTDASGVCDSYKACQFPSCPDDAHWPPECWIRMPSLSKSAVTADPTCDAIAVNLTGIQSGNLAISGITLEVNSAEGAMPQTAISFSGSYTAPLSAKVKAVAGKSYVLIFRLTACLDGLCKNGPASKAVTVVTKARQLTYVVKGSCAYFSLDAPNDGCETVKSIAISCLDIARAVNIAGNGTTICGIDAAVTYRCSAIVVNSQDFKEEYAVTFPPTSGDGTDGSADGKLGAIVGGAVGGIVALSCLVVVLVVLMRRRLHCFQKPEIKTAAGGSAAYMLDIRAGEECTYENLSDMTLVQFERHIAEEATVLERFKEQAANLLNPSLVGAKPENKPKNRFQNILPYDKNIVTLRRQSAGDSGYINASYIGGYSEAKYYIATQGPLAKTVDDFWDMVWQEGAHVIVMLTDYTERSKTKCASYFPKSSSNKSDITVSIQSTNKFDAFSISKLEVKKGTQSRKIYQCHFLAWPDQAIPKHCAEILTFLKTTGSLLQTMESNREGPIIVHCSAGVGRTGAYIALDYLLQRYQAEGHVNVDRCVQSLREQRMLMVQTKEQYLFVHQALLHAMKSARFIMDIEELSAYSKALTEVSNGENPCSNEWKILHQCCHLKRSEGLDPASVDKSSPMMQQTHEPSCFAKPRYCKSFYSSMGFLPVAWPSLDSQPEFWQALYEGNVNTILVLHPLPEDQRLLKYWPDEGSQMKAGSFVIQNLGKSDSSDSVLTALDLQIHSSSVKTQEVRTVKMLVMETWSQADDVPIDRQQFYKVLIRLRNLCKEHGGHPMAVQCSDGVGHCGLFIAAMNALCRLIETNLVQVFHSVELARFDHPLFVKNKTQYSFLYDMLRLHCDIENIYANC